MMRPCCHCCVVELVGPDSSFARLHAAASAGLMCSVLVDEWGAAVAQSTLCHLCCLLLHLALLLCPDTVTWTTVLVPLLPPFVFRVRPFLQHTETCQPSSPTPSHRPCTHRPSANAAHTLTLLRSTNNQLEQLQLHSIHSH